MAFDDVFFFQIFFYGYSQGGVVAAWGNYISLLFILFFLITSNAWTVVEYSKKSFVLYISIYSYIRCERRKSYTRQA